MALTLGGTPEETEQQAIIDYLRAVDAANKAAAAEPVAPIERAPEDDNIFYYDLEGNFVNGPRPEYGAYDPEYAAFRESSTSPIPDSSYLQNSWGFGSPVYNYETGDYSSPGIVWNGLGPEPENGFGIDDLFKGSIIEGAEYNQNDEGGWSVVPGTGGLVDRPPVDDEDRELTLGGNYPSGLGGSQGNPPDVPGEEFPYLPPSTGSDGVTFGEPPLDREWGKYLPEDYESIDNTESSFNPNQGETSLMPSIDKSEDYDWQSAAADMLRYAQPSQKGEGEFKFGSDIGGGNFQGAGTQSGQGPNGLGRGMGQLGVFTGGPSGSYGGGSVWNAVKAAAGE